LGGGSRPFSLRIAAERLRFTVVVHGGALIMQPDDPVSEYDATKYLFTVESDEMWHRYIPPAALGGLMVAIWLLSTPSFGGSSWAISRQSLEQGRVAPLFLHMFAHGGLLHVMMNTISLIILSPPLIKHLGRPPICFARYLYLFIGSGLSGAALFLTVHSGEASSMLGASGAIFGLLGALTRIHPSTGARVQILSGRTWALAKIFAREHAAVLLLFGLVTLLTPASGSIAWEAHVGGLLFGLFATPIFLRGSSN
jgi:membrane associated rhomboid family serine protease